jgi:hypothetical protein
VHISPHAFHAAERVGIVLLGIQVTKLLADYLQRYRIAPVMDEHEVKHWLSFQVCPCLACLARCVDTVGASGMPGTQTSCHSMYHGLVFDKSAVQPDVIHSYVVEGPDNSITDMLSFYTLPSSVIGNDQYDSLKVRSKMPCPVAPYARLTATQAAQLGCSTLPISMRDPVSQHPCYICEAC